MQQEERVSVLRELKDELLEYRNEFEGYSTYENFDASFRMQDPECKNVKLLSAFDLYISTVLPLEHKEIRYIPVCTRLQVCATQFPGTRHVLLETMEAFLPLTTIWHKEVIVTTFSSLSSP